jgi:hypothetical protein
LTELGVALRRARHRVVAREPLTQALGLAARPLARRAREELHAGTRAGTTTAGIEALTPASCA